MMTLIVVTASGSVSSGQSLELALKSDALGTVDVEECLLHGRRMLQSLYLHAVSTHNYTRNRYNGHFTARCCA